MILKTLLMFWLCTLCAAEDPAENEADVDHWVSLWKDSFKMDSTHPPYLDQEISNEPTCVDYYPSCQQTRLFFRHFLLRINKTEVGFHDHIEDTAENRGNEPTTTK